MPTKISPCLWFDHEAEDAARFYTTIFKDSKIVAISRYPEAGQEIHGKPAGSVMTVAFELNGQSFTALNGGPIFKFNEAVSFQIPVDTQAEIERLEWKDVHFDLVKYEQFTAALATENEEAISKAEKEWRGSALVEYVRAEAGQSL